MNHSILSILILLLIQSTSFSQGNSRQKIKNGKNLKQINWSKLADSLQQRTYDVYLSPDKKYFLHDNRGNQKFNYWWNAHALDVLVDAYNRTKDKAYIEKMKSLVSGIKEANGGTFYNEFYDDMEWLALASLRAYDAIKDPEFKELSVLLWKDIQTGLNDHQGGGLAWRKSQLYYKNTPANAPAIILASRLYQMDKKEADFEIAKQLYGWLKKILVDTTTGYVHDGINREQNGKIDPWKLTYNQGVFIGAGIELFKVTGDKNYLTDAIKTADNATTDPEFIPGGIFKDEGNEDGGLFKGILIRYLALLCQDKNVPKEKREAYRKIIQTNAETLANQGIKRPEMLVATIWNKRPTDKTDYSTQLSGLMLIEAMTRIK